MKKILLLAAISILVLTACGTGKARQKAEKGLDLDVSEGTEILDYDTHGGFHGDGISCVALRFDDGKTAEQIKESGKWRPFPLDETVKALVYGVTYKDGTEAYSVGPYLQDEDGKALIPEIKNGYYLMIDRQEGKSGAAEAGLLERASMNFSLGIYDTDSDTLYYCEYDS